MPDGDTKSFYPQWSPDGKYIAVLTAQSKVSSAAGSSGIGWRDYDLVYGEDSPLAAAQSITILDAGGTKVTSVGLDDRMVAYPLWSADSSTLGFFGATKANDAYPGIRLDSVWTARMSGASSSATSLVPEKIADFPPDGGETSYADAILTPDGNGVYFHTGAYEQNLLWFAAKDKAPVEVLPDKRVTFAVQGTSMGVFGDSIVATASW